MFAFCFVRFSSKLRSRDWWWRTPSLLSCGELVIQAALSVGDPVKNRKTSELKEFAALM